MSYADRAREFESRYFARPMKFFATCARGTEGPLRRELASLRIAGARGNRGGVTFEGDLPFGMRACLWSRVAVRVLGEVGRFPSHDAGALYDGARAIDWSAWLTPRHTLAVHANVKDTPALAHSGFAALKVKDAVVDALRDRQGARPDVAPDDPDVGLVLHLAAGEAVLYVDLSGPVLHQRGYRLAMTEAPLKETLAAAVLALGGVSPEEPFVDPMCGSGTLAIEHALAARRMAPGLRRRFGFERWPAFDDAARAAWSRLEKEAAAAALPRAPAPIVCRDRDPAALDAARKNAAAAGVEADIAFEAGAVRDLRPSARAGTICTNPPYGERLRERDLDALYRDMAEAFRQHVGWRVVILCGNPALEQAIGVRPAVSHRLWNGPIEVRLLRYDLPN